MTVRLADDLWWVEECYDIGDAHRHVSVYVIREADRYVMVDSGSFYHEEGIIEGVMEVTGGAGVDAILLSHSDYPHSANIEHFRPEGHEVELIASSGAPAAQGLSDATKCDIGGEMTVCGRRFSFIDPPLADRSHTTWIYDHGSGTLFAADGFGSHHQPGQCAMTSADFPDGIPEAAIREFHRDELVWLRYVDPGKLRAALEAIFEAFPPSFVAPIHGHPIVGDDIQEYLDRLIRAAGDIADGYEVPA